MRRSARIGLEVIAGLLGLLLVATLVLVWRFSSGPVEANFLAPGIQAALERVATGYRAKTEKIEIAWTGWRSAFEVQAIDLVLLDREGEIAASVPRVAVELSLRALLKGVIAPTSIALYGVRLQLERHADGSIGFGSAAPQKVDGEPPDLSPLAEDLLAELFTGTKGSGRLSYLESLAVRGARVEVKDQRLDLVWRAPHATILLEREAGGLRGEARLDLDLAGDRADLSLDLRYREDSEQVAVRAQLQSLKPASLAGMSGKLAFLEGIELPFDASLAGRLRPDGQLLSLTFEATGRPGLISRPDLFPQALAASYGAVSGRYEEAEKTLWIEGATLQLGGAEGGPVVDVEARLEPAGEGRALVLAARLNNVRAEELPRYWPLPLAPNARNWVAENITEGRASDGSLEALVLLPREGEPEMKRLAGGFLFEELAVHYLRPMPPITGLTGRAEVEGDRLRFLAERGSSGELAVTGAKVEIAGLGGEPVEQLSLAAEIEGPLAAALALVNHPRLALLSELGLAPAGVGGTARTQLALALPLKKEPAFADVELTATSRISDAVLRNLLEGKDLTEGNVELQATAERMEVTGSVALAGVPMTGVWREDFEGKGPAHSLDLKVIQLDDRGRAAFGLSAGEYLEGPLAGRLVLSADRNGNGRAEVSADLAAARLALPFAGWEKLPGTAGQADFLVDLSDWQPKRVSKLAVETADLSLAGEIAFRDGKFARATLERVALGRSRLSRLDLQPFGEDGIATRFQGGVLDLSGLELRGGTRGMGVGRTTIASRAAKRAGFLPLSIEGSGLERLLLGPDRYLEDVSVTMLRHPDGWRRIVASGSVPRPFWRHDGTQPGEAGTARKSFSFEYGPQGEDGGYRLSFLTEDMGASLRALGILDTLEGGRLTVKGRLPGPLPHAPLIATVESDSFRLVEAPVLGRILTLASLTGIANTLQGEGIAFDRLTGSIHLEEDLASSELLRAYGAALGLTAKGRLDFAGSGTEIAGTVVPAYSINRVLGKIPLLGRLITGGEGEGVLAVTYSITGPVEDLQVSVNPLSALAPGFLRGLFGLGAGTGEGGETPSALPPSGGER